MRWALLLGGAAVLLSVASMHPSDVRRKFALMDAQLDPANLLKRVKDLERRVDGLERRG